MTRRYTVVRVCDLVTVAVQFVFVHAAVVRSLPSTTASVVMPRSARARGRSGVIRRTARHARVGGGSFSGGSDHVWSPSRFAQADLDMLRLSHISVGRWRSVIHLVLGHRERVYFTERYDRLGTVTPLPAIACFKCLPPAVHHVLRPSTW